MAENSSPDVSRRTVLRGASGLAVGATLSGIAAGAAAAPSAAGAAVGDACLLYTNPSPRSLL
jgi:hypothetical protein